MGRFPVNPQVMYYYLTVYLLHNFVLLLRVLYLYEIHFFHVTQTFGPS